MTKGERGRKTGLDALEMAVTDAGAEVLQYVPGYPITEAGQALGAQMAVNEKVAFEVALGASATGQRSMVLVKHLGANLLADPLSISPTHTIGAGLVVLVGEDVGPKGSQIELDVRHHAALCELPVLDPAGPKSLYPSIIEAYQLSERISAPVMVRMTFRPTETYEDEIHRTGISPGSNTFDRAIWGLTARGRHQRYLRDVLPIIANASETTSLNFLESSGDLGVIACGRPAHLARDLQVSLLAPGYAHPLPWKMIERFILDHRKILVAEEPGPFVESRLRMSDKVCGKLTGHLPFGRLEAADLERALETIDKPGRQRYDVETAKGQGQGARTICDDCPYLPLYKAIKNLGVPVAGDAGCSIRAVRPPLDVVDVVYGLGSSVGVASGFAGKGIAVVGDYALAHTGLQGLINALYHGREVLIVLLKNEVAAMTGGQKVPDIVPVVEAVVPRVERLKMPVHQDEIEAVLKRELARPGISVVVASGRCPREPGHRLKEKSPREL